MLPCVELQSTSKSKFNSSKHFSSHVFQIDATDFKFINKKKLIFLTRDYSSLVKLQ